MLGPHRGVHVLAGEQDLGYHPVILSEQLVVDVHHGALAHGGCGLLHPQLGGPLPLAQLGAADGDGAGGHQNHLMPHALQVGQGAGQMLHVLQFQLAGVVGQGGGAHLHHHPQAGLALFQGSHAPYTWSHHTTSGPIRKEPFPKIHRFCSTVWKTKKFRTEFMLFSVVILPPLRYNGVC